MSLFIQGGGDNACGHPIPSCTILAMGAVNCLLLANQLYTRRLHYPNTRYTKIYLSKHKKLVPKCHVRPVCIIKLKV